MATFASSPSSSSSSYPSSVATVNFGGINTSNIEFVNYSNAQLKEFSLHMLGAFEAFGGKTLTIKEFLNKYISNTRFITSLLENATTFANEAFDLEKIFNNDVPLERRTLSFETMSMGQFFSKFLCRDKGIGGFEQPLSKRPCNLSKKLGYFVDMKDDGNTINQEKYIKTLYEFYSGNGENDINQMMSSLDVAKSYSAMFMKGRKEAADGKSTMNYYNDPLERTKSLDNWFHSMAKLVLIVYDLITMELMNGFECGLPSEICGSIDETSVNTKKSIFVAEMFEQQALDILFITEAIPGVFDDFFDEDDDIDIVEGEELNGLCNTIIYRVGQHSPIKSVLDMYEIEDYENPEEYKELPLVLSDSKQLITLVCFHANGKGITVNGPIADSSFKQLLDSLPGKVIVGCDLNIDYKKVGTELDSNFDVGHLEKGGFTCYKQRGPVQPQFDKTGVFDKKHCDFIITKNIPRVSGEQQIVRSLANGHITAVSGEHEFSEEQLVIPNDDFPFEHYIVIDTFNIYIDTSTRAVSIFKYAFDGIYEFIHNWTQYYVQDMMPGVVDRD